MVIIILCVYGHRAFKNLDGIGMEHLILVCLSAMIMRSKFHRESKTEDSRIAAEYAYSYNYFVINGGVDK